MANLAKVKIQLESAKFKVKTYKNGIKIMFILTLNFAVIQDILLNEICISNNSLNNIKVETI